MRRSATVFALFAAACVGDTSSLEDLTPLTPTEFCTERLELERARITECFGIPEDIWPRADTFTEDRRICGAANLAVELGLAAYDPKLARGCLAAIEARACDNYVHEIPPDPCSRVLTGAIALHEPCEASPDWCAAGTVCDVSDPPLGGCTLTCVPEVGTLLEGADCPTVRDCARGLFCDISGGTSVCSLKRGRGDRCLEDVDCDDGLVCALQVGGFKCEPPVPPGGVCLRGGCGVGYLCSEEMRCIRRQGIGEPCERGGCFAPLAYCGFSNTCEVRAFQGEFCLDVPCAEPLVCGDDGNPLHKECMHPRGECTRP